MTRLFIHDKCMEQLFNLPKPIQKKVLEFQKKFRENPKAPAIHLEPIHDFKDGLMRTARVDQKYRAVISVPESGEDYYLLWVDNHDEAMDWARTKTFLWNKETGTAQIFNTPVADAVKSTPVELPAKEELFGTYTDEQLLAIGLPEPLLPAIRDLSSLNDLDNIEQQLPADTFENLFYLADGVAIEQLITEIKEGAGANANSINNLRSFIEVDDKLLEDYLNGDLAKWQIFLHPSQRKLVDVDFNGPVKVSGGGGTGKTVVALHRLKYLSSRDVNDKPILFTTYTNALTKNLEELISKLGIPSSKCKVVNIDKLVSELSRQINIIHNDYRILDMPGNKQSIDLWENVLEQKLSTFETSFLNKEYQAVWLYNNVNSPEEYYKTSRIGRGSPLTRKQKMEVAGLIADYENYKKEHRFVDKLELYNKLTNFFKDSSEKPFSHIIADEIQDLSNIELRFLRSLVSEGTNDLFLVGDPYQNIYAKKVNFSSAGISIRGHRSKKLRINYRTTEEIKRLAISAVRGFSYDDFDGSAEKMDGYLSLFHGDKPVYKIFKSKDEEVAFIIGLVNESQKQGLTLNNMVIACRLKETIRAIKTSLHKERISYYDIVDKTGDNSGIHLSTFHSLKGLEYKIVILADVNNQTAPLKIDGYNDMDEIQRTEYLQSERSLIYVAITRAINKLFITGFGIKSELVNV